MNLFEAVIKGDWGSYCTLLRDGADVFAIDTNGDTVLHKLARQEPVVEGIFSKKKSIQTYFSEIRFARKGGESILELALRQNNLKHTPMHTALSEGNWPLAHLLGELLAYKVNPKHFRRNEYGLNEYEWALLLHGVWGRRYDIEAVFGLSGNFLYGGTTLRFEVDGLVELKKAVNAIKIDKDILCDNSHIRDKWQSLSDEQKENVRNFDKRQSSNLSFLGNEDIEVKNSPD